MPGYARRAFQCRKVRMYTLTAIKLSLFFLKTMLFLPIIKVQQSPR